MRTPNWLTNLGLYYKLHGVHRPVTMKKSVIKRRKRVIPAAHEVAQEGSAPAESIESSSPPPDMASERGSMNPDGSVNLGLRRRQDNHQQQQQQQKQQALQLVPESVLRQNRPSPPLSSGRDLTQYSSNVRHHRETMPGSLTDNNRLAPITSLAGTAGRQSSLSPASFLSPARKRSFGETEASSSADSENKRLSSIKSILNPAAAASSAGPSSTPAPSPPQMASAPSPGAYSTGSPTPSLALPARGGAEARRQSDESDVSKAERRAALQWEADRMREMLAAKERELAELGQ